MYKPIDLSAFSQEREESLKRLLRYQLYETVLYRSSVWQHTQRMLWLAEELLPQIRAYIELDEEKVRILTQVHDDAEIITGDVPAGNKARFNGDEKKRFDDEETKASDALAARYPKQVHGYEYRALLHDAQHKESVEAQFVSFLDKIDAFCESLHETFAGNFPLVTSTVFYARSVGRFQYLYPALAPMLQSRAHSLLLELNPTPPAHKVGFSDYHLFNKPHTRESLVAPSRFPFYDEWRRIVVSRGGEEGVRWLTEVKESVQ